MKKPRKPDPDRESMRPEYDFSKGVRNKYAPKLRRSTNVVLLDPDVAQAFSNSKAVNKALRELIETGSSAKPRARRRRTA